jgi:hypothetical protein
LDPARFHDGITADRNGAISLLIKEKGTMTTIQLLAKWMIKVIAYLILIVVNIDNVQSTMGEEEAVCPPFDRPALSLRTGIGTLILSISNPGDFNGNWISTFKYTVCLTGISPES